MDRTFGFKLSTVISGLLVLMVLLYLPVTTDARSCPPPKRQFEQAELIFSFIPMKAELTDRNAYHYGDVYRVWKGEVYEQEEVITDFDYPLSLGEEYIIAWKRDEDGRFQMIDCVRTWSTHNMDNWLKEILGEPKFVFKPSIIGRPLKQ